MRATSRVGGRIVYPLLDSVRAIAALSILVIHVAIFTNPFGDPIYGRLVAHLDIGVPFFFLLSAFLLYRPFVAAQVDGEQYGSLRAYARKRFWRIAPAYWAALTIAAIVPGMAGTFSRNWWVYYGLLQNFPIFTATGACATDPYRCGIPPAWSLAVEVFFYALLPLLVLAVAALVRLIGRRWWLRINLAIVVAISLISIVIQSLTIDSDLDFWLFFSPLGRGWWFGLGLAMAALSVAADRRRNPIPLVAWLRAHPGPPVALALALYVFACEVLLSASPSLGFNLGAKLPYVTQYLLFGLIAALFLLPIVFTPDSRKGLYRRVLAHRSLAWLGLVSYGIFLWQFPVLIALLDIDATAALPFLPAFPALLILTLAGTVICATLSFYLLERPVMRRFRSGGWPIGIATRLRSDSRGPE